MAEKTLILKVDLSCKSCCKKMHKILCKFKDQWCIKKVTWDKDKDEIVLVGCFDPQKLRKQLCCLACRCINDFIIPKPPDPPKPPPKPCCCPPPKPCCCPPPEPCCPKPKTCPPPEPCPKPKPCPPPEPCCPKPKPCPPPEPCCPKPKPCPPPEPCLKPPPPPPETCPPVSLWVNGKICTCRPCAEKQRPCSCDCGSSSYHRRCCCEDRRYDGCGYGYGCQPPPPPPICGRPTCQVICDDGAPSACSIM